MKKYASVLTAYIGVAILLVVFALMNPNFIKTRNLYPLVRSICPYLLVGIGQGIVCITGNIDLSIGSVLGMSAMISATLICNGVNPILAIIIDLCACLLVGLVNGVLVGKFGLPPFIGTLGTMTICRGLAELVNGNYNTGDIGSGTLATAFRDAFYYKRVFVGAVRAVDFICSLPQFNGKQLGVSGSSQGGMLSFVTAALDSRVTFYAVVHPAMCDHTASLKKQPCGWPHYFYGKKADDKKVTVSRYYDGINFVRRIKVPGWFSFGYNDDVVAPTSMYAAYNTVSAPKEFKPYLQTGHYWYQEQYDEWNEWMWKQMDL